MKLITVFTVLLICYISSVVSYVPSSVDQESLFTTHLLDLSPNAIAQRGHDPIEFSLDDGTVVGYATITCIGNVLRVYVKVLVHLSLETVHFWVGASSQFPNNPPHLWGHTASGASYYDLTGNEYTFEFEVPPRRIGHDACIRVAIVLELREFCGSWSNLEDLQYSNPYCAWNFEIGYPSDRAYFYTTIHHPSGNDFSFDGWCVDTWRWLYPNVPLTGRLYSTYDPVVLNSEPLVFARRPERFPEANYLINHVEYFTNPYNSRQCSWRDVQNALWTIMDILDEPLDNSDPDCVSWIVEETLTHGANYIPPCPGGKYLVLVVPVDCNCTQTDGQVTVIVVRGDCFADCRVQYCRHTVWGCGPSCHRRYGDNATCVIDYCFDHECVPCPVSASPWPLPSPCPSESSTPSPSDTPCPSYSSSPSDTPCPSYTSSPSDTPCPSYSSSPSDTPCPSYSSSPSDTPCPSYSSSPSDTAAPSHSPCESSSSTPAPSPCESHTPSHTAKKSRSNTPAPSPCESDTPTPAPSPCESTTPSHTAKKSRSNTPAPSPCESTTPTAVPTPCESKTSTPVPSPCESHTPSHTAKKSRSNTPAPSPCESDTPTPVPSPCESHTPSHTAKKSRSNTPAPSPCESETPSHTAKKSRSNTPAPSPCESETPSHTAKKSRSNTPAPSPCESETPSKSRRPSRSQEPPCETDSPSKSRRPSRSHEPPCETDSPSRSPEPPCEKDSKSPSRSPDCDKDGGGHGGWTGGGGHGGWNGGWDDGKDGGRGGHDKDGGWKGRDVEQRDTTRSTQKVAEKYWF